MAELPTIDGPLIMHRRTDLGLSRDKFAELVGVRPGALWRFEVKNNIRPDELTHLVEIADRWLTCDITTALQHVSQVPKTTPVKRPVKAVATVVQRSDGDDTFDAEIDLVQWADVLPVEAERQLRVVYGDAKTSPTMLTADDGFMRVSNSEVGTFKRCRRKWWLTYVRGLQSLHEQPFGARATGTRLHAALAAWYRPDDEERVDPRDALEIIIAHERAQLEASDAVSEESLKKFNADAELERVVVEGYMKWLSDTGSDTGYTVLGSEQYLEASLPEIENMKIIARLDARVLRTYDRARLFIDHKSVASIPQAAQLLTMNTQMMWYILLEQLQPDLEPIQRVAGALYNMMRRCKRTAAAKPPFYERIEVHYNPHEIAAFRQWLLGTLDDMTFCREQLVHRDVSHHLVVYPTPTRDCTWDCPFLKVCSMANDGSRFEDAIANHYVVGDPYGYYQSPVERGVQ